MTAFRWKKKRFISGIELTEDWLKLVRLRYGSGGKEIVGLRARYIQGKSDKEISKEIADIASSLKISKNYDYINASIPRQQAVVRFLKLPSAEPKEVEKIMAFQAIKEIPYSPEETIVDFQIIGLDENNFSKVLLTIVHTGIVERYLRIFKAARIEPEKLTLSSQAISSFYSEFSPFPNETALLIDIDYSITSLEVVSQSKIIFSRSIYIGSSELADKELNNSADNRWRKLLDEVGRSLELYRKGMIYQKVDKMIFLNSDMTVPGLEELFRGEFSVPVEVLKTSQRLPPIKESLDLFDYRDNRLSLAGVVGLALKKTDAGIDLLPRQIKTEKLILRQRSKIIAGLAFTLVIFFGLSGFYFAKLHRTESYLKQLNIEIKETESEAKGIRLLLGQTQLIRNGLDVSSSGIEVVTELYEIVPPEISLTFLELEEKEKLILRGVASTMSDIFKLSAALEESNRFKSIELKYAAQKKIRGVELTNFQLVCSLAEEDKSNSERK